MSTLGSLAVGSSVYLNVDGVRTEFLVVHQGIPDETLYDASCNGTWLLMKGIYEKREWHSSLSTQYAPSTIHEYLNSDFLGLLDSVVQERIKQVKIPYAKGNSTSTVYSGSSGLSAKLFLLSGYEIGFTTDDGSFPADGSCLAYFDGAEDSDRVAYLDGEATMWWLRSPHSDEEYVWAMMPGGYEYSSGLAIVSYGIRPALILPADSDIYAFGAVIAPMSVKQCRLPRKMKTGFIKLHLSGDLNVSYAYVAIDGATYATAQTLKLKAGTEVTVTVSGTITSQCTITLNGETVKSGSGSYTFNATDGCRIVFSKSLYLSYYYYTAAITMPYTG